MSSDEWAGARWFKAEASGDHGCVEVTFHDGKVGVRDSKDTSKAPHSFTRHEWSCFLAGAKAGEFDLPQH